MRRAMERPPYHLGWEDEMNAKLTKRDDVVYVTLENGKTYRLDHLLEHRRHIRYVDEVRQDQTRRREWYRRHVESRDVPNSKAARADYGDNGKMVGYMVAALDGKFKPFGEKSIIVPTDWGVQLGDKWYFRCVVAKSNCKLVARKLMLVDWRRIGYFVAAVWKNGHEDHEKTMQDFGISQATYYRRLDEYASILHFSRNC